MGQIFANQTLLTIKIETGIDLTSFTSAIIKYTNGNGIAGQWVAAIDAPATAGIISFDGYDGTLYPDQYTIWGVLTSNSGKTIPTECGQVTFFAEGC